MHLPGNLSLALDCSLQRQFCNCLAWLWFYGPNTRLYYSKIIRAIPFLRLYCSLEGSCRQNACPCWTITFPLHTLPSMVSSHTSHPQVAFISSAEHCTAGSSFCSSDLLLGTGWFQDLRKPPSCWASGRAPQPPSRHTALAGAQRALGNPGWSLHGCWHWSSWQQMMKEWGEVGKQTGIQLGYSGASCPPHFQSVAVLPANEI